MGSESQHDGWAECVFSMCRIILNGSKMDVGAMQECDAMDGGAGGGLYLRESLCSVDANSFERAGWNEKKK
jgi:hypothetical protein